MKFERTNLLYDILHQYRFFFSFLNSNHHTKLFHKQWNFKNLKNLCISNFFYDFLLHSHNHVLSFSSAYYCLHIPFIILLGVNYNQSLRNEFFFHNDHYSRILFFYYKIENSITIVNVYGLLHAIPLQQQSRNRETVQSECIQSKKKQHFFLNQYINNKFIFQTVLHFAFH